MPGPEQHRDEEEVEPLEHDGARARVLLAVVEEVLRHLGPVAVGLEVVADVVAVVEAARGCSRC